MSQLQKAPKEAAATSLRLAGATVKTEESALYDSQSNGLAESAVQDVKDAVRTNLACLVRRLGQEFAGEHSCLALACEAPSPPPPPPSPLPRSDGGTVAGEGPMA